MRRDFYRPHRTTNQFQLVSGARNTKPNTNSAKTADKLKRMKRLVELQAEIVLIAQRNSKAKEHCVALREELSADQVSRRGLRKSLRGFNLLVRRLWTNGRETNGN